jgi:hypothetical protein
MRQGVQCRRLGRIVTMTGVAKSRCSVFTGQLEIAPTYLQIIEFKKNRSNQRKQDQITADFWAKFSIEINISQPQLTVGCWASNLNFQPTLRASITFGLIRSANCEDLSPKVHLFHKF